MFSTDFTLSEWGSYSEDKRIESTRAARDAEEYKVPP